MVPLLVMICVFPVPGLLAEGNARSGVFSPGHQEGAEVDTLLREAYQNSPALQAAHARWDASLQKIPQARALPDPRIGYSHFIERMNTRQIFRVEQMLPAWGTRSLLADAAGEAAQAAADALEGVAADLRRDLLISLADWILVGQSEELVADNLQLVRQLEEVALQRYRSGEVSQADVLRLQMEAETLRVDLEAWREREPSSRARVNALLGREPDAALPEVTALPVRALETGRAADRLALEANPELKELQSRIREANRGADLARKANRPNVMLGIEYMDNHGVARDEVVAMVSVNLPIWRSRINALNREAQANLRAAEREFESVRLQLEASARRAYYEQRDTARRVRLFKESLLPRARQTLTLLESEYRTGRSGFLDLLEAQRNVLDLELSLARASADHFIRSAQWERIAGPFDYSLPQP